jgi:RecA-family ATPase
VSTLRESISHLPHPPTLVVVDTLSQTFSGDENSSTDISSYLRLLNTHLRAAFNATVIVVHHTGHVASERPRGSSAITANLDFLLGCFRPNADALAAQIEVIKQKDGDKLNAQYFELAREVLEKDEDGEEVSSLVASWHDAIKAVKESALKLTRYEQAFVDAMPQGQDVSETELRRVLNEMVENAASRRQTWKRTIDGLREKRMIKPTGVGKWKRI